MISNSFVGNTMENLRKRINANDKDHVKCISTPSFVPQKIFSKNFVVIHEIKPVLTPNKPSGNRH